MPRRLLVVALCCLAVLCADTPLATAAVPREVPPDNILFPNINLPITIEPFFPDRAFTVATPPHCTDSIFCDLEVSTPGDPKNGIAHAFKPFAKPVGSQVKLWKVTFYSENKPVHIFLLVDQN